MVTTGTEDKAGGNVEQRQEVSKGAGGGAQVRKARRPSMGERAKVNDTVVPNVRE